LKGTSNKEKIKSFFQFLECTLQIQSHNFGWEFFDSVATYFIQFEYKFKTCDELSSPPMMDIKSFATVDCDDDPAELYFTFMPELP